METKSHPRADPRRVFVAVAVATLAAMFTAGFAIRHRPESGAPAHTTAAVAPAQTGAPAPVHDPSLPDAAEAIHGPATTSEDPPPTF